MVHHKSEERESSSQTCKKEWFNLGFNVLAVVDKHVCSQF